MSISDPALNSAVRLVERLERELAANPIEAMQRNPGAWSAQARSCQTGHSAVEPAKLRPQPPFSVRDRRAELRYDASAHRDL